MQQYRDALEQVGTIVLLTEFFTALGFRQLERLLGVSGRAPLDFHDRDDTCRKIALHKKEEYRHARYVYGALQAAGIDPQPAAEKLLSIAYPIGAVLGLTQTDLDLPFLQRVDVAAIEERLSLLAAAPRFDTARPSLRLALAVGQQEDPALLLFLAWLLDWGGMFHHMNFADGSYFPFTVVSNLIVKEERGHTRLGNRFVRHVAARHPALLASWRQQHWPLVEQFFGRDTPFAQELLRLGIKSRTNQSMYDEFQAAAARVMAC